MKSEKFDLTKLQIASPCSVDWNNMHGDDRKRFCDLCQLNVYNVAGMTEKEVRELVSLANGRLCMRLMRRADGCVMTRDCPVGLAVYRKRVARFAGATIAAVLGLFSISYGQKNGLQGPPMSRAKIARTTSDKIVLIGTVRDGNGAALPDALVRVWAEGSAISTTAKSDSEGKFYMPLQKSAVYSLEISLTSFRPYKTDTLRMSRNEQIDLNVVLEWNDEPMTIMGDVVSLPSSRPVIDLNSFEFKPLQSSKPDHEN